jgi:hypothetical protein
MASVRGGGGPRGSDDFLQHILNGLQNAAQRHDARACRHDDCKRCAGLRASGRMCSLPGCCARARENGRKLLRCGRCRAATYCGAPHQRCDWERHKLECRTVQRGADDDGAASD